MTTKVKNVQGDGSWFSEKHNKDFYSFEYEFEDGKVGKANHLTNEPKFKQGELVDYEITGTDNQGIARLRISKPQSNGFSSSTDQKIQRGCAIKAAATLYTAHKNPNVEEVVSVAKRLTDYINTGE